MEVTCTSSTSCASCSATLGQWPDAFVPAQFPMATMDVSNLFVYTDFDKVPTGFRPDSVVGGVLSYTGGNGNTIMQLNDVIQIKQNFTLDANDNPDVVPWSVILLTNATEKGDTVPIVCPFTSEARSLDTSTTALNMLVQVLPAPYIGTTLLPLIALLAGQAPFLIPLTSTDSKDGTNMTGFGKKPYLWGFVPVPGQPTCIDIFGAGCPTVYGNVVVVNNVHEPVYGKDSTATLAVAQTWRIQTRDDSAWSIRTLLNTVRDENYLWNNVIVPVGSPVAYNPGLLGNQTFVAALSITELFYISSAVFTKFNALQFTTYDADTGLAVSWQGALNYYAAWGDGQPAHFGAVEDCTGINAIAYGKSRTCFQGLYGDTCYGVDWVPFDAAGNALPLPLPFKTTFYMPMRYWAVPLSYVLNSQEVIPKGTGTSQDGKPMTMVVSARPTRTGGANIYFFTTLSAAPPATGSEQVSSQQLASETRQEWNDRLGVATIVFIVLIIVALVVLILGVWLRSRRAAAAKITINNAAAPKAEVEKVLAGPKAAAAAGGRMFTRLRR